MATKLKHSASITTLQDSDATGSSRPCVVLIEDNPLTSWAIDQALAPSFDLMHCPHIADAEKELAGTNSCFVIFGSPIADERPDEVVRIAKAAPNRVLALVSDPDNPLLTKLNWVLEKPFDLSQLIALLNMALRQNIELHKGVIHVNSREHESRSNPQSGARPLELRLRDRFQREVCPICIHRTSNGGCSITNRVDRFECPVFEWADKIAELVRELSSPRLEDYINQIQSIICPDCKQDPKGRCKDRDRLDCPADLYAGLIIPIIEEELAAERSA
jgi:hypothetical protein